MSETPFTEAIRTESDEYLRRYLRNGRTDNISMVHKNAVRMELERRKR